MSAIEVYRPVEPLAIASATRIAAQKMAEYVCKDLQIVPASLRWFAATDRPLTIDELVDPVIECLNTNTEGGVRLQGHVCDATPSVIWLRKDLRPYDAARVVAHEVRHLWQISVGWKPPEPNLKDAIATGEARTLWRCKREADAKAYSDAVEAKVQQIAHSV